MKIKMANEQVDLSSSEDEISSSILKEAIDQQFLNDNLYITKKAEFVSESKLETNKSNEKSFRSLKQDEFTNFGITDTFQNFIAKKLDEILERTIKLKNSKATECFIHKRKRNKNSGIKLLSTSKKFVTTKEITKLLTKHKEKLGKCSLEITEDSKALSKFQEAAIDPECILSKLDMTVLYNGYSKPELRYKKLKNGILIEV